MLSPKMQRTIRVNESQLIMLSERAQYDYSQAGYLHKRSADNSKWQLRWFVLYQVNYSQFSLLFFYLSSLLESHVLLRLGKLSQTKRSITLGRMLL